MHHERYVTAVLYVEDVLLVDRCLTGEPAATRELFRRHKNRVHACLFRVLGSNRDMDDLLQEAFLAAPIATCRRSSAGSRPIRSTTRRRSSSPPPRPAPVRAASSPAMACCGSTPCSTSCRPRRGWRSRCTRSTAARSPTPRSWSARR
ncbi:MAG: hypothetical protein E6J91_38665 [Deltaproteobacteria bacterium]|nr:MAG: hypothetical protein E6J91_38665 [Deltaproteobacteria bacterium]